MLGLSPGTVYDAEQRAIVTLRGLYETMTATGALSSPETLTVATSPAIGRPHKPITAGQRQYHQRQHAEQQAKLEASFLSMQEQGLPITGLSLKRAAQVNYKAACAFVQGHCPQNAERARLRSRGGPRQWGGPPRKANRPTSEEPAHEAAGGEA